MKKLMTDGMHKKSQVLGVVSSADDVRRHLQLADICDTPAPFLEFASSNDCGGDPGRASSSSRESLGCPTLTLDSDQGEGSSSRTELFGFEYGVHYTLIEGRLYFSCHPDDAYTADVIQRDKSLFYFSSNIPGDVSQSPSSRSQVAS
jgi:hypothetical protein